MKCDPTLFRNFKNQAPWDYWNHNNIGTACNQDVEDIFHEAYVTPTPDDRAIFRGENTFTQFLLNTPNPPRKENCM